MKQAVFLNLYNRAGSRKQVSKKRENDCGKEYGIIRGLLRIFASSAEA